jgi:two-component system cell cycle sensor histidine kinase/response regulator CckA
VIRTLRVLHLEDSPRDAAIVRDRLNEGLSCSILVVNGKHSFEAALAGEPFDLIISDYSLPGYDGVTALKQAQSIQPDVPFILISGTVVEEQAVRCLHIGATDYLFKDRLDRLVPAVQRALQEAETRRKRKAAEAALGESEARKAAILDSVLDCIVTMDANGTVIEFNTAAVRTFGYTKEEAIGRPLAELIIPPRFHERHRAGLALHLATGEGPVIGKLIEIMAMRSDGTELPVELAITAIQSGAASIFTGVLRDITARRHAEATRARLAAIVDSSDDAIFSMAMDETILSWNAGAERLYGYTAREMIGRNRALLVPAGKSAELVSVMERAARGETGEAVETRRLRKDGSVVDISLVTSPMTDSTGRITSVSAIARDITRRKKAEAALRDERDRAQRYLDTAEVMLLALDLDKQITLINRKGCDVLGWNADELLGRPWIDTCLPPRFRDEMRQKFDAVVHGDVSITMSYESRVLVRSGEERLIEWRNTLLRDETGQIAGTFSSGTDITERRALEEQYQQAQKMEAIGRLAGGVAHDFNNLLTVILGFCELLLADLDPTDARQADIVEIQKAGTSAAGLTRQLLTFSRKEIIQPTLLDLNAIVADMRVLLGRLIGEHVEIRLGLGRTVAPVKADRGQVEQIILNLAVNARDAMQNGGTLMIETANVSADECQAKARFVGTPCPCVALTVTDTGTGMTPEVRARLFEPFFTTKGIGKGTGLGLATVHGIVTRSGGSVTVDSEVGKGASFTVYFPQADAAEQVVAPPPAERPPAGRRTVLVVEDARSLRALTKRLLERLGYSVLVAANADEARQLFDRHPSIDLLLTDVVMPGASGPELVGQLTARRPTLNVIYMSGYTDESIIQHGVLAPEIAFLHKPFTSETLGRKLREVLDP